MGTCATIPANTACAMDTHCQHLYYAIGVWASQSWNSSNVAIYLLDKGPTGGYPGIYLTNTFTGNAGYNNTAGLQTIPIS